MKEGSTSFVMILLLVLVVLFDFGCGKDSSTDPATPATPTYPTITPNWKGSAREASGSTYSLVASLGQTDDKLNGFCVWQNTVGTNACVKYYNGTVTSAKRVSLQGYKCAGSTEWQLDAWNANLSAGGDTISGTFASLAGGGASGTFVLVKKTATESYPAVATSWKGTVRQQGLTGSWSPTVNIVQAQEVLVTTWTYAMSSVTLTVYNTGSITSKREIRLQDNFNEPALAGWTLMTTTATLSATGDTISGTWVDNARNTGTVVLLKQ
jgi:hypothetical protein